MSDSMSAADPHVLNEDRWAAVPEALLYDPHLSDGAVRVYGALRRHGDDPKNCYPSYKRIGELIGKSSRTIPALIRSLEDAGWLDRVARFAESGDYTSNAYRVYGRAQMRGVRAESRGPSAHENGEGSAHQNAPKESHLEREQMNDSLSPRVDDAFAVLVERDVESGNPDNKRAYRTACRRERREDGTVSMLTELAHAHPEWTATELADACDGPPMGEETEQVPWCRHCRASGEHWSHDHEQVAV